MYPTYNLNFVSRTITKRCFFAYCTNRKDFRTHYDVLRLHPTCTDKEIKESFAKLSKECHPDLSKDKNSHHDFVRLMEAYSTLAKPKLRERYDFSLGLRYHNQMYGRGGMSTDHGSSHMHRPWTVASDFGQTNQNHRPKISKLSIVLCCIFIAVIGAAFQLLLINAAFKRNQKVIAEINAKNGKILNTLREQQNLYSDNGEHVEDIMRRQNQEFDTEENPRLVRVEAQAYDKTL